MNAGIAETIITTPVGLAMQGWASRAAGHNLATYVHDDLYVKSVYFESGEDSACVTVLDISGIDAVFAEEVRGIVGESTGLSANSIMISATHCHSAPSIRPVAASCSPEDFKNITVAGSGSLDLGEKPYLKIQPSVLGGEINREFRGELIEKTASTIISAWNSREPVRLLYGEADVAGVASSRRVFLKNGEWGDPRSEGFNEKDVENRTEIDPLVRNIFIQSKATGKMIGVLVNYGTHPWLLSVSGYSAELSGVVAAKIAAEFAEDEEPPIVLYTSGPLGDVTMIWNLDIEEMWTRHSEETIEESLARREKVFDVELEKMGGRMLDGVTDAWRSAKEIAALESVSACSNQVVLPFKDGYVGHHPDVVQTNRQKEENRGQLTEIQRLSIGSLTILGLPGEPFTSLGREIRDKAGKEPLMIIAHANDSGGFQYIADAEEYRRGGYEMVISTLGEKAGAVLVDEAISLVDCSAKRT